MACDWSIWSALLSNPTRQWPTINNETLSSKRRAAVWVNHKTRNTGHACTHIATITFLPHRIWALEENNEAVLCFIFGSHLPGVRFCHNFRGENAQKKFYWKKYNNQYQMCGKMCLLTPVPTVLDCSRFRRTPRPRTPCCWRPASHWQQATWPRTTTTPPRSRKVSSLTWRGSSVLGGGIFTTVM